jgi:hypothetical protein
MSKSSRVVYQKKTIKDDEKNPVEIGIEDFIPDFVDPSNRYIASVVSERKEFTSVASSPTDEIKEGKLLPAQEFVGRYMMSADRFILIWQPGVGKLCGVVSPAEKFRYYSKVASENTNIKKTVILLKGGGAVKQFKNKIKCECSDTILGDMIKDPQAFNKWYIIMTWKTFINKNILKKGERLGIGLGLGESESEDEDEEESVEDESKSDLSDENYVSDEELEDTVLEGKQKESYSGKREIDMERVKKEFAGTLFVIDEFHNLRSGAGVPDTDYTILQTVFDNVPNIKVIGSSATPMFDKAEEIIPSLNLILPKDKRLPVDLDLENIKYTRFAPYIRGFISYVKSPSSAATPDYSENKGVPVVLKNISKTFKSKDDDGKEFTGEIYSPVYWIPISNSQRIAYKKLVDSIEPSKLEMKDLDKDKSSLYHIHRSILHGVFPGNNIDYKGFILKDPNDPDRISASKELIRGIENNLAELSPKYDFCMRVINNTPGKIFSYFVQIQGSYLDFFSLILDSNGFTRYSGRSESIRTVRKRYFKQTLQTMKEKYCSVQDNKEKIMIPKAKRYAIITGTSGSEAKDKDILEVFNSPENVNGEYIKILIASPVFRETYSLTDVMTVLNMSVYWNISSSYQAEYRVIRTGSHRNYIRVTGDQNPKVTIYRIGMYDPENLPEIDDNYNLSIPKYCPVDILLYQMATQKDIGIHKILRYMKRSSVDSIINYRRNVLSLRENLRGTKECDYQDCKYPINPKEIKTFNDNFDILYADDVLKQILDVIKSIFQINSSIYRKDLENLICDKLYPNADKSTRKMVYKYIYMALYECIYNNKILTDFFGFPVVCNRNGDYYYITRNGLEGYGDTMYMNTSYLVENNEILKYVKYQTSSASYQAEVIRTVMSIDSKDSSETKKFVVDPSYLKTRFEMDETLYKSIEKKINALTVSQKTVLLETALLYDATNLLVLNGDREIKVPEISKEEFDTYQVAKQVFKGYYFCINKPIQAIQNKTIEAKNRGVGKGRKPKNIYEFEIKKIVDATINYYLKEIPPGSTEYINPITREIKQVEPVYIHFMHVYYNPLQTGYNIVSNYYNPKNTRYLDLNYKKYDDSALIWRESTGIEKYIFGNIVQLLNISKNDNIRRQIKFIYGFILSDKKFRIVNLLEEKSVQKRTKTAKEEKEEEGEKDSRTAIRGSNCTNYDVLKLLELFNLMYQENYIQLPTVESILKEISPKKKMTLEMMAEKINEFSSEIKLKSEEKKLYNQFLSEIEDVEDYETLPDSIKYKIIGFYSFFYLYSNIKKSDVDTVNLLSGDNWKKLIFYIFYYNTVDNMCKVLYQILEKNNLIFYDDIDVDPSMQNYLYKF